MVEKKKNKTKKSIKCSRKTRGRGSNKKVSKSKKTKKISKSNGGLGWGPVRSHISEGTEGDDNSSRQSSSKPKCDKNSDLRNKYYSIRKIYYNASEIDKKIKYLNNYENQLNTDDIAKINSIKNKFYNIENIEIIIELITEGKISALITDPDRVEEHDCYILTKYQGSIDDINININEDNENTLKNSLEQLEEIKPQRLKQMKNVVSSIFGRKPTVNEE